MTRLRSASFSAPRSAGSPALRRILLACRTVAKRRWAVVSVGQAFRPANGRRAKALPHIRGAVTTAAGVVIGGSTSVFACPACFGAEETSMIDGTKLGVLVLLAITLAVQGGFVGFFFYLRKRAKRIADVDLDTEWSELQGSPRTS
jgi:hypothetical protein